LGKWREETIAPQLVYRRYGICQRHFKAEDILLNAGPQGRPRLKKDAIPLPYRQAKVKVQDSSSEVNSQESVKPLADVEPDISQIPLNGSPSEPSVPKELLEKKIDFKTAL